MPASPQSTHPPKSLSLSNNQFPIDDGACCAIGFSRRWDRMSNMTQRDRPPLHIPQAGSPLLDVPLAGKGRKCWRDIWLHSTRIGANKSLTNGFFRCYLLSSSADLHDLNQWQALTKMTDHMLLVWERLRPLRARALNNCCADHRYPESSMQDTRDKDADQTAD